MLIRGDARTLPLRDGCVACVVTSPPYWGLRDYGSSGQIGLEPTPEAYVAALVEVFREVRRVLKDDGTAWVNLGDTFNSSPSNQYSSSVGARGSKALDRQARSVDGLKPKDLVGIPWRVAFALQADGWYLRADIIWSKPNPMPESVTDRPTKAHEYIFLLSKSARYYYDADAIAEPLQESSLERGYAYRDKNYISAKMQSAPDDVRAKGDWHGKRYIPEARNKRSVWHIATQPYAGAHFATMPESLITPCILAGCPLGGLVFDPFCGTGTVGTVASRLGRRWVGVDLTYQDLARTRTAQRGLLFTEASA
jgi:DNA modification methylase